MMKKCKIKPIIINGEKSRYSVTSDGDVYTTDRWSGKDVKRKLRQDKDGYYTVGLYHDKKYHEYRVSRLVSDAFVRVPLRYRFKYSKEDLQVNHKNGIHTDNHYKNLEWTTPKGNIKHAWKTGLSKARYSEDSPNSKYTNDQIHEVCSLLQDDILSYKDIADKTGVSYTIVKQIKNKIIWTEISDMYNLPGKKRGCRKPLKKRQVKKICKYIKKGFSDKDISKKFNISATTVYNIRTRKSHTDVTDHINF